ncbi:hypothetical protein, partial [Streptomyces sp. NPDC057582]|uniref:hypothetical protein n=1 Tax=Streptomyces sp. NPDC057582 TaxID=3346174 RepID=UPI0036CBD51E
MIPQADVDVNGRPARAHVAGQTVTQAVDLLQDRLAERLAQHWEARHDRPRVAQEDEEHTAVAGPERPGAPRRWGGDGGGTQTGVAGSGRRRRAP